MKLKNIELPMAEIERFCQRWNLTEFALFGSVLRDDFCIDSSDIDVMVQYRADAIPTFYDLDCMETDLEKLFGRAVDVVTRRSIENSRNYLRRQEILSSARVIYETYLAFHYEASASGFGCRPTPTSATLRPPLSW